MLRCPSPPSERLRTPTNSSTRPPSVKLSARRMCVSPTLHTRMQRRPTTTIHNKSTTKQKPSHHAARTAATHPVCHWPAGRAPGPARVRGLPSSPARARRSAKVCGPPCLRPPGRGALLCVAGPLRGSGWRGSRATAVQPCRHAVGAYACDHRWNRNPRPQPQKFSKLVCLISFGYLVFHCS